MPSLPRCIFSSSDLPPLCHRLHQLTDLTLTLPSHPAIYPGWRASHLVSLKSLNKLQSLKVTPSLTPVVFDSLTLSAYLKCH